MEYESINMLFNGNYWSNINEVHELGPRTLRVIKNNDEYRVCAEEDYQNSMLNKYCPYIEKAVGVNLNGQTVKVWAPVSGIKESVHAVEECLKTAIDFISEDKI